MTELSTAGLSRRTPDGDALRGFPGRLAPLDSLAPFDRIYLAPFDRIDLELLGVHLVVTCVAVYAAARLGVGAGRGVVVGPVAYLLAVSRHPEGSRS